MKLKEGFTLIELLAVIVILAIIALIASPVVTMLIENTKQKSAELGADGYLDGFETKISTSIIKRKSFSDGDYKIGGKYLSKYPVLVDGEAPTAGDVTVTNGKITEARLCILGRSINYDGTKTSKENTLNYCDGSVTFTDSLTHPNFAVYSTGDVVYFNPVLNDFCTQTDFNNNTNASVVGNVNGCMKWYVITINDDNTKEYVDLIANHNTTALAEWGRINTSSSSTKYGPISALQTLATSTSSWQTTMNWKSIDNPYIGKTNPTDTFGYEGMYIINNVGTIIPNSSLGASSRVINNLHARLITAEELAKICGFTTWLPNSYNGFALNNCSWLLGSSSYWTATNYLYNNNTLHAWGVTVSRGDLFTGQNVAAASTGYGIRPVISVEKEFGE